jgi:uncharacterized protein (DUF58 family)
MKRIQGLRWLLVVIILFGLGGWVVTGMMIYARLAFIGLLLLVGAVIWAVLSLRGIRLSRSSRTLRASMGEVFEERFEVRNLAWPGCLWLEILNKSNLPMAGGSRMLTSIGTHQRRFYTARTVLTRRGEYLLGPTTLASGDIFGIFTLRKQIPATDMLVVLPMAVPIKDFPPPPGLFPGGKAVRLHTMDVTPHAAGVREYVPGDPMKRIHWPSTARRGRFMVKEFEQDPQADIWIFLDAQRDIHHSLPEQQEGFSEDGWWLRRPKLSLPADTFEYGISAAASLAGYFLDERRAVGLACAAGKFTVVSADRGERQVSKIMETLAFLQPEGIMPLLGLVTMQAKLLQLGSGVILITPSVRPELLLAVEDLQRRSLRPVVVLIKNDTFGGNESTEDMAAGLIRRNVPVCQIGLKDDLSIQLALPVVYFKRPYMPRSYFNVRA